MGTSILLSFEFRVLSFEFRVLDLELWVLGFGVRALAFGAPSLDQVGPEGLADFFAEVARMRVYLCMGAGAKYALPLRPAYRISTYVLVRDYYIMGMGGWG